MKCAYSFCTKTFCTEKGRNGHYRSTEGKFHERIATSSLKRKFSDYDGASTVPSDEENANSPMPECETTAGDPQDITSESQFEVDDDLGFLSGGPLILDTASEDSRFSNASANSLFVENYPGAADIIDTGPNMYAQRLEADSEHSGGREVVGPWYPFAGRVEWELAKWLNSANLSMNKIDEFLRLDYVSTTVIIALFTDRLPDAETRTFVHFIQRIEAAYRSTSGHSSLETGCGQSIRGEDSPTIRSFLSACTRLFQVSFW